MVAIGRLLLADNPESICISLLQAGRNRTVEHDTPRHEDPKGTTQSIFREREGRQSPKWSRSPKRASCGVPRVVNRSLADFDRPVEEVFSRSKKFGVASELARGIGIERK